MDRGGEKVAYYCSELARQQQNDSLHQANNNNNGTNNNNNITGKYDNAEPKHDDQQQMHNVQQLQEGQSTNDSGGDYPPMTNRFQANNDSHQLQLVDQQGKQFIQNQIITGVQQQQQSLHQSPLTAATQPQYLVSSSNPQNLTNLTAPHHFNNQHPNNGTPFQNQLHPVSYHINSNHHLYQAGGINQQQQPGEVRTSLFHQKSNSLVTQDESNHSKPQVIFHDGNKKQQFITDQELQRRQQIAVQQQHNVQTNLTTSQSASHSDFNKLRRKSEHLGLTSEVGLDDLDLRFEAFLRNDNQSIPNSNSQILYKQQHPNTGGGQNFDKLLRSLANQQGSNYNICDRQNNGSDMSSSVGYGRPSQREGEDNIYEEIDAKTMDRLQAEYPVDSISLHSDTWKKKNAKKLISFTRWFSTRKKSSNSQNSDQEDNPYLGSNSIRRPRLITLPDIVLENLTSEKLKRRLIVKSIVDSENSYTNSLYRLIYEYKKPLRESDPPILSNNKIGIIFFCLDQILQFHQIFGLALSHHVQEWDEKEMIGSVFTTNFSKPMVLDIYSDFINNFTNAMETARRASKSKAFAQFLHDKSVSSPDRLSFFGSMVKPVQRFPQFILLLSDLLKHTPFNHPDRMPLQRALTELESLADRLNERKRYAERHFAVKQLLKDHLNESNAHSHRFLLRQDDTCLMELDPSTNSILKTKSRKMYLLNDMLICVSTPSNRLKFAVPLSDISVIDSITPDISNLLAHSNLKNLNETNAPPQSQSYTIERIKCERQSLVHDLELMMSIASLVQSLRFQYNGLNPAAPEQICIGIRDEIRKKEFQMTLIDRSCLQLRLHSKNNKETLVVQFSSPESKRDWLIDVRLTKLALDRANCPAWEPVSDNPMLANQASLCSIGQRIPLFVKSFAIFKSDQSQLTCALHYYLRQAPYLGENPAGVLWICNVHVGVSSLGALASNGAQFDLIHTFELSDSYVTCLESVGSTLWIGLKQGKIIVIDANSPSEWVQFASLDVQHEVTCIKYFGHFVYVGLISGVVAVFDAINFDKPYLIQLNQSPVTCLLPINDEVFACSHNRIWRIKETNIVDSIVVQTDNILPLEEEPRPNLLAHCGSGIWVSLIDSPIVKLYHAETMKHLVDINVGNSIKRFFNDSRPVTVTSMMATRGLLWIGTNVGMIASLTLPRLQGVPLVSESINVALHRFLGPVNLMLNLSAGSECVPQMPFNNRAQQQVKPNHMMKSEEVEAIYGQYADLMNVGDYITAGGKPGTMNENPADLLAQELSNVNISAMNTSDDSGSSASSGAIYGQGGVPRAIKQQNNAMMANAVAANMAAAQMQQNQPPQLQNQQAQPLQGPMMPGTAGPAPQQSNQMNDLNHVYDKTPIQATTYNQGSLNGVQVPIAQNLSEGVSMDRLQQHQLQQHQQRQMLSASQTQLAKSELNSQADYGSQSGKMPNKLYDQPPQQLVLQQQQMIQQQQGRQSGNPMDPSMLSNNIQGTPSTYGSLVGGKTRNYMGNKTVLVLAGGVGFERIGDNQVFRDHSHCIIWEYKA